MHADRRMENSIEVARLAYCEHLIRDNDLDPEEMADFLCLDGQLEKACKWLAFGVAKRRYDPDRVRGLLIYLVSHEFKAKPDREKRSWLAERIEQKSIQMQDLTIEMLAGTFLRWEHIFALVGKEFNPTREKERLREVYTELIEKHRKEFCQNESQV
ncbi:hypothetical protein HYR54_03040 [Candidatus Acetothermia bacterium]|nr:hypothetical protein [Candidatus Acetothermia bacterium]